MLYTKLKSECANACNQANIASNAKQPRGFGSYNFGNRSFGASGFLSTSMVKCVIDLVCEVDTGGSMSVISNFTYKRFEIYAIENNILQWLTIRSIEKGI